MACMELFVLSAKTHKFILMINDISVLLPKSFISSDNENDNYNECDEDDGCWTFAFVHWVRKSTSLLHQLCYKGVKMTNQIVINWNK